MAETAMQNNSALRTQPIKGTGILSAPMLRHLIETGEIAADTPIPEGQIQPASLDLRLGAVAHRVRASFLPGRNATVQQKIDQFGMHAIDLEKGAVLERGCVYIVPLMERLKLRAGLSGMANPKSSTGRLDIFTRVITDHGEAFEAIPAGYDGPLYAEIAPRTFSVLVRQGTRLNQLRLRRGQPSLGASELHALHLAQQLTDRPLDKEELLRGVPFSVDLVGDASAPGFGDGVIGFRARRNAGLIDLDNIAGYAVEDFWEPLHAAKASPGGLVLNPDDFYILASKETVAVPPEYAAEMVAYDTSVGEFRVHYAGFFDPGFGHGVAGGREGGIGSRAVLEVRSHDVPFLIEDGQLVGRLVYEKLAGEPDKLYGQGIGSSYQRQGLTLGKQFRR
ncbi:MAG: 2'-deoxycytidine 5'-triphosphate deaminase [Alphaproteobacteria bacterium]|nr:2'-deoxycytidine 5'-triphosphate deaminase [Alphaproteobacteria bacterium]MBU0798332.1 2'-deoxycytidine 5'-triphosphate deaminase [Alphaproteobacteria bacterium]MBU0887433.1 2'-deoxycytidine 5'-triphosphate deaminase [Alphaproteobacteria bacterium]MBU1813358.1 2'-deoxycytidine 5'-triphosphate deaminase [Alphaproteobacteria bacterium]